SGLPVNPLTLELIPLDEVASSVPAFIRTTVAEAGSFEFVGVQPGKYSIVAKDNSPSGHLVGRTEVVAVDKDVDNVRVELRAGAAIKCLVRTDQPPVEVHDVASVPPRVPPQKVTILLRSVDGGHLSSSVAVEEMPGSAPRLRDIPPGRYWVEF